MYEYSKLMRMQKSEQSEMKESLNISKQTVDIKSVKNRSKSNKWVIC